MLMMDTARKDAVVAVSVENGVIQEDNLVRDGLHLQVVERVVYLQWGDSRLAVRSDSTYQVDVVQFSYQAHPAFAPCLNVSQERAAETPQEL